LFAAITVAMYTFMRFMFVCIWKRMRQMNDNLIVRIATIQAIVMSLLFSAATWLKVHGHGMGLEVSFYHFLCKNLLRGDSTTMRTEVCHFMTPPPPHLR
jgi:hypothetical protein